MSGSRKSPAATDGWAPPAARTPNFIGRQEYEGVIPPPITLQQFDALVPGTARRLIQWAEDEQRHRQALEREAQAANIMAQQRQLALAEHQTRAVFFSDALGQLLGFLVCLSCVMGAVWIAQAGHTAVAIALAAIPTAAIIQAFRLGLLSQRPQEQVKPAG